MTVAFVAEADIAACLPAPVGLLLAAQADLSAKLSAMIAFSVQLGLPALSFDAQLQLVAQIEAALRASIAFGITPPSLNVQLDAALAAIATLKLQLQLYIDLLAIMAHAGVFIYTYDGPTNAAGGEIATALASGFPGHGATDHANMLILGTVDAATWTAMTQVFKTAP